MTTGSHTPRSRLGLVAALLLALTLAGCPKLVARQGPAAPPVRQVAPDFTLESARGQRLALSALVAKGPVVVAFYRGFW